MTLRSNTIHYLDPEVIQNYANVVLISKHGERLRCNSLILAACKSALVYSFNPDDETHYIITEFSEIGKLSSGSIFSIFYHFSNFFCRAPKCPEFLQNWWISRHRRPPQSLWIFQWTRRRSQQLSSSRTTSSWSVPPSWTQSWLEGQRWTFGFLWRRGWRLWPKQTGIWWWRWLWLRLCHSKS